MSWQFHQKSGIVILQCSVCENRLFRERARGKQPSMRIPLMATGDLEVKPTGIPLGSRPVFRCDGDRQMMRLRGVNVTVS